MRLTLETDDIIKILGKHFGTVLKSEQVSIKTDPFEVTVSGIPLTEPETEVAPDTNVVPMRSSGETASARAPANASARDDAEASEEPPPEGLDGVDPTGEGTFHPAAVLAKSREVEAQLDRENPTLARSHTNTMKKPPEDFTGEIS